MFLATEVGKFFSLGWRVLGPRLTKRRAPLVSLGLARRHSGFLYAGAAAVPAPVFLVAGHMYWKIFFWGGRSFDPDDGCGLSLLAISHALGI